MKKYYKYMPLGDCDDYDIYAVESAEDEQMLIEQFRGSITAGKGECAYPIVPRWERITNKEMSKQMRDDTMTFSKTMYDANMELSALVRAAVDKNGWDEVQSAIAGMFQNDMDLSFLICFYVLHGPMSGHRLQNDGSAPFNTWLQLQCSRQDLVDALKNAAV